MEIYILDNKNLNILSVCRPCNYNLNLDEETNGKSEIVLPSLNFAKKGFYLVFNGLYKQFLFVIDDVITSKEEKAVTVSLLDISNIFDRKIILRDRENMLTNGIENYIANEMDRNFINSNDSILNLNYVDVYVHSTTRANVTINDEDNLYNFHTYLINCRQYKNIYTEFKFEGIANRRLKIDIENKSESTMLIDTTLAEVTGYNKVYEVDPVTKVEAYVRENGSVYNLYLRTDRTTTTNKNDVNRLEGRIETISCDTLENAQEEALNVIRANTYKHLVEFNIAKSSKLIDVKNLYIGRPIKIKTQDSIYDSYISAIILSDENFVQYKTGNLRIDFTDKQRLQQRSGIAGTKLDVSGGNVTGTLKVQGKEVATTDIVKIHSYSNIAEMIADVKISERQFLQTMGYYEKDDGGSAKYYVTENVDNITTNDGFHIILDNGLVANLLIENNTVSILQIGGKRQKNNVHFDNKNTILAYINKNKNSAVKFSLFFPYGIYYTSPVQINSNHFSLIGETTVTGSSIITAIANQEYVIKVGDYSNGCGLNKISNLTISSAVYDDYLAVLSYHEISIACLVLSFTYFLSSEYLEFSNIKGIALKIDSSWELWFNILNFQHINSFGNACLVFDTCNTEIFSGNANLSDCEFNSMRFEQIVSDCIQIKQNTRIVNLHFGTINVEPSRITDMNIPFADVTGNETFEDINAVIRLFGDCDFIVDSIHANNFYFRYYTIDNKNYVFGDFIRINAFNILYKIIINSISIWYARNMTPCLLKSLNYYDNPYSRIIFNNIINNCSQNLKVQARLCGTIILKDSLSGNNNYNDNLYAFNGAVPCYKNVLMNNLSSFGIISYDEDSRNPEKLVLSCHENMTGVGKRIFSFIASSNKLIVRAKITNGATLPIAIYYNNNGSWDSLVSSGGDLVGTGDYKNYEINLNTSNMLGQQCFFQLRDNNVHHYAKFDTFIN